jgi:hypothetical protein
MEVNGELIKLQMARRVLPTICNGVRVYLCDTRAMADYTGARHKTFRNGLTKDAMICLSDPAKPLLDPERICVPSGSQRWLSVVDG